MAGGPGLADAIGETGLVSGIAGGWSTVMNA